MSCILFNGQAEVEGYGYVSYGGKARLAHRVAYVEHHGVPYESIKGVIVRHTCDVKKCINPAHLILGTHQDNMDDMTRRGRQQQNESHWNVKLSDSDVDRIRCDYQFRHPEFGGKAMAVKYGVSTAQISRIINNVNRKG